MRELLSGYSLIYDYVYGILLYNKYVCEDMTSHHVPLYHIKSRCIASHDM